MCAFVWKRVRPQITPRASGRQRGAKRPEKAGTITQPSLSGTLAASSSTSAAYSISPRLSRSHCTSAPVTAIEPSSMYAGGSSPSR